MAPHRPLDATPGIGQPGELQGDPCSEGAIPGGGQFGVLRIHDDGTNVAVDMVGRNWKGERLLHYRFTVTPPPALDGITEGPQARVREATGVS